MTQTDYKFPEMDEAAIMKQEEDIFNRLCGNQLTGEVAAWLSIVHSHFCRLNNRVAELERLCAHAQNAPESDS